MGSFTILRSNPVKKKPARKTVAKRKPAPKRKTVARRNPVKLTQNAAPNFIRDFKKSGKSPTRQNVQVALTLSGFDMVFSNGKGWSLYKSSIAGDESLIILNKNKISEYRNWKQLPHRIP